MNDSDQQDDGRTKEFLQKINQLDFGPLAHKLMYPDDRPGLSFEQALDGIKKYKGFLFLCHANQGKSIAPSKYVDYVWHNHILDTELYWAQTGELFGHYLHHFPFFGKRNAADEAALQAAGDFAKREAFRRFGWDEDDWCGTGRKPHPPGSHSSLTDLFHAIFPAGLDGAGPNSNPDSVTIQAGNFRHTIEHWDFGVDSSISPWRSRDDRIARLLKSLFGNPSCMPAELGFINEISVIRNIEKWVEISARLVENRLKPAGYSAALVELQMGGQVVHG